MMAFAKANHSQWGISTRDIASLELAVWLRQKSFSSLFSLHSEFSLPATTWVTPVKYLSACLPACIHACIHTHTRMHWQTVGREKKKRNRRKKKTVKFGHHDPMRLLQDNTGKGRNLPCVEWFWESFLIMSLEYGPTSFGGLIRNLFKREGRKEERKGVTSFACLANVSSFQTLISFVDREGGKKERWEPNRKTEGKEEVGDFHQKREVSTPSSRGGKLAQTYFFYWRCLILKAFFPFFFLSYLPSRSS